ncbi:MAG TPA: M48 family metalloprotease [Caulobacteraceae bacterium]|jgi:STE24 endopeptidase|nr:M48 family metalloprotease [Caulobacteraceae bacterium]
MFDPHAATETLLGALPAAARLKAVHYTQGGHWLLLWSWLVGVLASVIIARAAVLPRVRDRIERRRGRPWLAAFGVAVVFFVVDSVLELPWEAYAHWWREKSYGLTSQPFVGWLGEGLIGLVIGLLVFGVFFMILYALVRRAPRTWWLWAAAAAAALQVIGMIAAPVLIEPIFNHYTPAPPGPTRDAVVALAEKAGVPSDRIYIYNGSKQSNRYTANVSGLFGSARVAMSDEMFAKGADIAEVRGVVGHEMGHYKRHHVLIGTAFLTLLALAVFFLVDRLFPVVNRWVGTGAAALADPVGLPALMIVLSTLLVIATPIQESFSRWEESDADAFSLRVANEPDGMARALVKTIEYRADSPSALEEFLFYDHPSVRRRVQRAMDWKAAHLALARRQEAADGVVGAPGESAPAS